VGKAVVRIDRSIRDELVKVAQSDFGGVTLGEAVRRLIIEHHFAMINQRYEELGDDAEAWVLDAREEYPEYNQ
jgi:hypothetical protein